MKSVANALLKVMTFETKRFMRYFTIAGLLFIGSGGYSQPGLSTSVSNELATNKGTFAVAFKNLQTGETMLINAQESFHAASTMKTPVMIEVYKQASQGKFKLKDSIKVKNEFKSIVDGSPFTLTAESDSDQGIYKQIGKKRTIHSLMYDMIIVSSNLATNIIIELVDAKKVTQTMQEMGATGVNVLRGVEDQKAYDKGLSNSVTAYGLMVIFEKIATGHAVSPAASEEMVKILSDQKYGSIIPALLPKDVKVAHKTGWITALHHDSGIVILPDGRKYVLVILSKNLGNEETAVQSMARVSRIVFDYFR